jgi:uncharacterized repeat protein (TIGR01451 family)
MTQPPVMPPRGAAAASAAARLRWQRIVAIAMAAVSMASCRGIPSATLLGTAVVSEAEADAEFAVSRPDVGENHVVRTGLDRPSPPLPRLGPSACRACGFGGPAADMGVSACPPAACPVTPPPPVVGPYLVCDGGDHQRPAVAIGPDRLGHLTAGDTVARYHAADEMPDACAPRLAVSTCACVFAPRFGAVREVTRPLEEARPEGPRGYVADETVELEERRDPVCGKVQTVALEAARKSLPGVAVQDRIGPLAVDQGDVPGEDAAVQSPVEDIAEQTPELARQRQQPAVKVGFDVPIAWTCIKAANVLLGDQPAQAVAVDRGTATLRFEEPGRAELTLCKRAGTDTARSGEELDFTIVMLNSGDRSLAGVVLADALPMRLAYVPQSAAANVEADFATETGDDGSTVLTWRLRETLRPGESRFVRFRTRVQ